MIDLIGAEWLKLRTTRLLHGTIPAAVVLSVAAVSGAVLSSDSAGELESADGIRRVFSFTAAGAIVLLVVGIVVSAGEYQHGTAADTFLTTPRRNRVVLAKLALGATVGLAAGALTALGCLGAAGALYPAEDASLALGSGDVWKGVAGAVVYSTLFASLGVAIGALVRNQVLAIAGALAWLAIVEHTVVNLVPAIGRWLPVGAGEAIVRAPLDDLLPPLAGAAVLAAYTVMFATAAVRVAVRRDV